MRNLSSITRWGIKSGFDCSKSTESCVYLAAADYDDTEYKSCAQKLLDHDLILPHVVGYPPKGDHDTKVIVNYARLNKLQPELCQYESFAISCKSRFSIPWNCLEAAINTITNSLLWVNPDFYGTYLAKPAGATHLEVKVEPPDEEQEETPNLAARVSQLLLEKCADRNCALCTRCARKEQVGTLWCYDCGEPMVMQKGLPMRHADIVNLTPQRSITATAAPSSSSSGKGKTEQGETHRATGKGSQRDVHGFTVGNLTRAQRMRQWRKSAFKKKDDVT